MPGVVRVDRGDQLELGIVGDRLAHGRAHAPAGAEHPDPDHRRRGYCAAQSGRAIERRSRSARNGIARLVDRADDGERARVPIADTAGRRRARRRRRSTASTRADELVERRHLAHAISSLRPRRCMRLAELSSDSASEPVR